MEGIRYVVDEKGRRVAVMIDLDSELWEDIHDQIVAAERANETDVSADLVEKDLARRQRRRRG